MSKLVKRLIVEELARTFEGIEDAVIIGCAGLDAAQAFDFRNVLREKGARLAIVKNKLARKVLADRGFEFGEDTFSGVTAIVFGNGDAVGAAKAVKDWAKENKKELPFKGAVLGGDVMSADEAAKLVDMPSVEQIKGMLVGAIAGPLNALVGITNNILTGVPLALQAIADKKQEEGA